MRPSLSVVDRVIRKLGPVNALVENLCERLLPNEEAHASGYYVYVCGDTPCGLGQRHYGRYLCMHIVNTGQNIDCVYDSCSC